MELTHDNCYCCLESAEDWNCQNAKYMNKYIDKQIDMPLNSAKNFGINWSINCDMY